MASPAQATAGSEYPSDGEGRGEPGPRPDDGNGGGGVVAALGGEGLGGVADDGRGPLLARGEHQDGAFR